MKIVTFRSRRDKLEAVARLFTPYLAGEVLDVGCDSRMLASIPRRYVGVDIAGKPDVFASAEVPLPFGNGSFDTAIAFDVLEHVDHVHAAFDELCRVSRNFILIGLPNFYTWHFRLNFLLGKSPSGKYGLPAEAPADRHRWIFGYDEARQFVRSRGGVNGFRVVEEVLGYYAFHRTLARLATRLAVQLAPRAAGVFAYHYWALLERTDPPP